MSSSQLVASPRARARDNLLRSMRSPVFRRFTAANLVSITGTWMQVVAQNWLVLRLTGDAAAVGLTVALQALPSVVFGLWGGVIADRMPKRRVLITTQLLLSTLALTLGLATIAGVVTIAFVYVLALLLGIVMAVDAPSYAAIGAELVPEDDLGNAIALSSVINGLGRIIGMSIAGALVATGGPGLIFVLNAMTYLAVIAVLHRLPAAATRTIHRSAPGDDGLLGGLRFVARTPVIIACASLAFVVAAFGRNFQVTMAAMSESVFHTGARGYGALSVVFAVGALVGGLVAARCSRYAVSLVVSVALTASALQFVSAAVPSFTTFAAVLFPIAIAAVVFDSIALATVQIAAGDAHRGRVVALFASAVMLGTTVGAPLLGWLADTQGGRTSLAVGGVVVFGAATVVGITHERLPVPWRLRTS